MYVKTSDPTVTFVDLPKLERELTEARAALAAADHPEHTTELIARVHRLEDQLAREQQHVATLQSTLAGQEEQLRAEIAAWKDEYNTLHQSRNGLLDELAIKQRQLNRHIAAHQAWEHERADLRRQLHREGLVRKGKTLRQELDTRDSGSLVWSLNDVGLLLLSEGRAPEAEELFRRALVVLDATVGRDDLATGTVLEHLATVSQQRDNLDAALSFYREAAEVFGSRLGPDHPRYANTLNSLGNVQRLRNQPGEAERLYREAIRIYSTGGKRHAVARAVTTHNLGVLMMDLARLEEAGPLLETSADLLARQRGGASAHAIVACRSLSDFYRVTGRPDRADHYRSLAQELAVDQLTP
jgi:tetratricopeptide (TPR) repeat protein